MRNFDHIFSLGGPPDYMEHKLDLLRDTLDSAIKLSGALQQPGRPSSEEAWQEELKQRAKLEGDLNDRIRDLAMALTGRHISFVKCGDILDSGETYWCNQCAECVRFSEEYALWESLYKEKISRSTYTKLAREVRERYEKNK